ncbi:hypothetical protein E2C01_024503 [Portunus trituberculatus]|uniref:Uncharacterized protein n=1 Tax=Portunus trituberculatus TaxID=210409 RepID=A0A5B7ED06_PORTR|nr:hypothetical protein [Portunus trituberculatus]
MVSRNTAYGNRGAVWGGRARGLEVGGVGGREARPRRCLPKTTTTTIAAANLLLPLNCWMYKATTCSSDPHTCTFPPG